MIGAITDRRVCVIGGAGFLGSHLVDYLINERKCKVLVLDNLISGLQKHIHDEAEFVKFDIREGTEKLVQLLAEYGIEYIFNYAAEPYIPECFSRPLHFFEINATAVLHVLEAARITNCPLLQVSSAEIYGDSTGKISEKAEIAPHSTYGVSKAAADALVQVRWKESGTPAIAMRQFNCVGERETHEYVIPEIINQLHVGPVVRLGNNSVRDFQYAGDAVQMAVELLECGHYGQVYNMGSETAIRIHDLARLIGELMGHELITIETNSAKVRPWEIWHLCSDNSKLYEVIETRPQVSLEEALKRTINYFRVNGGKWDW